MDELHQMEPGVYVETIKGHGAQVFNHLVMSDLLPHDFQVLEDGKAQKIERVTIRPGSQPDKGNGGTAHQQLSTGSDEPPSSSKPGAISVAVDLPRWPSYLIAYAQPPSSSGSCHEVTVKVDRPDALVYSRTEYCNTRYSLTDPLEGTKLGNQLNADLNLKKHGKIPLAVTTFASFSDSKSTHTDIVLGFPEKSFELEGAECAKPRWIAVLGILYDRSGTVKARFSHVAYFDFGGGFEGHSLPILIPNPASNPGSCVLRSPDRYETQVDLAPGQYSLRVVLTDNKGFGRAQTLIAIKTYDRHRLAISDIALAKRYQQAPAVSQKNSDDSPVGYLPLISRGFEVIPTANTAFKKGTPLDFYFQIYAPPEVNTGVKRKVDAEMRIVNAKTSQVVKTLQPADVARYATPGDPVIPIGGWIDIQGIPKGSYILEARARDSSGETTDWRRAHFTIER